MQGAMLSKEARSIKAGLNELAGAVDENAWKFIKKVQANLESLAEQIEAFENSPMVTREE